MTLLRNPVGSFENRPNLLPHYLYLSCLPWPSFLENPFPLFTSPFIYFPISQLSSFHSLCLFLSNLISLFRSHLFFVSLINGFTKPTIQFRRFLTNHGGKAWWGWFFFLFRNPNTPTSPRSSMAKLK